MKLLPSYSILAVILSSLITTASGQTARPDWKGIITTENGIKVVKNPNDPLYGTFAFDLEEDLTLGGDPEKADSYFPKGAQIAVDDSGNLYVSDRGNGRIQVFDKTGRFLRPLGRKGQGPGEYMFPGLVRFDADENVFVSNGRDWNRYGKDGIFQKKIALNKFFMQSILGPGATFIGLTQPSLAPGGPKYTLVLLDSEGKSPKTIAEERGEFSAGQNLIILHYYGNSFSLTSLTAETFAYGFSDKYRIVVADREGRPRMIVTKDEKPESITAKEKAANAKDGMYAMMGGSGEPKGEDLKYPDYRPYFQAFFNDDAGRLYVVRFKSILEKEPSSVVDVFSADGRYLYRMACKRLPAAIKGGYFYEVREDKETGEVSVVRSRIKNWDIMKND